MSDTPRTREETRWYESGIVHACFAAQLERELNAANERIKRLESFIAEVAKPWECTCWFNRHEKGRAECDWCRAEGMLKEAKP